MAKTVLLAWISLFSKKTMICQFFLNVMWIHYTFNMSGILMQELMEHFTKQHCLIITN